MPRQSPLSPYLHLPALSQAVVNERVNYHTLHDEMIAALETQDRKSNLLEASLLEKNAQLEAVQAQLQVSSRGSGGGWVGGWMAGLPISKMW